MTGKTHARRISRKGLGIQLLHAFGQIGIAATFDGASHLLLAVSGVALAVVAAMYSVTESDASDRSTMPTATTVGSDDASSGQVAADGENVA